jgi:hypothetical protein
MNLHYKKIPKILPIFVVKETTNLLNKNNCVHKPNQTAP